MEAEPCDIEETLYLEKVEEFEKKDLEVREKLKQLNAEAEATYKKIFALIEEDKKEILKKNFNRTYPRVEEIGELMDEFIRISDEQIEKIKTLSANLE